MEMTATNACKRRTVSFIIYVVCLLHLLISFEPAQYCFADFSRLTKLTFLVASLYGLIGFHKVKRKVDNLVYN